MLVAPKASTRSPDGATVSTNRQRDRFDEAPPVGLLYRPDIDRKTTGAAKITVDGGTVDGRLPGD